MQKEAIRLLDLEIEIFEELRKSKFVLSSNKDNQEQTFHKGNVDATIETLNGERHKVKNLELVIAVVGTMKAGKSTTINAIVGTEVLPNRDLPMTAIPTLITHAAGQTQPVLEFKNKEPIEALKQQLFAVFKDVSHKDALEKLSTNKPEMKKLIDRINNSQLCQSEYHGSKDIAEFLTELSDLVRLSAEFNLSFPFTEYGEINKMPVIKVEFEFLHGDESSALGKLSLLDTPGQNEAGQTHLEKMQEKLLQNASAVLVVVDGTQINSKADEQVREQLKRIAEVSKDRLFALVNKFDQTGRNSYTSEETIKYVANDLMEQVLPEECVFTVSAKQCYLANCALSALRKHNRLPEVQENLWVDDFLNLAFGTRAKRIKLDDFDVIKESADDLFESSNFHRPRNDVIVAAKNRAAPLSVQSAASKLKNISTNFENFINIRQTALSQSAEALEVEIKALHGDIKRVNDSEKSAHDLSNKALEQMLKKIQDDLNAKSIVLQKNIDEYFKTGGKDNNETNLKRIKEIDKILKDNPTGLLGAMRYIEKPEHKKTERLSNAEINSLKEEKQRLESQDFDPISSVIKFDDEGKAKELVSKISDLIKQTVEKSDEHLKLSINDALDLFQNNFTAQAEKNVQDIIDEFKNRMDNTGFTLHLNLPDSFLLQLPLSSEDFLNGAIELESRSVARSYVKDGWFSLLKNTLNSDWGKGYYVSDEKTYSISIDKLSKDCKNALEQSFQSLVQNIGDQIKKPLADNISAYFKEARVVFERVRADMLEGIRQKQNSTMELDELKHELAAFVKKSDGTMHDSDGLYSDIQNFLKEIKK